MEHRKRADTAAGAAAVRGEGIKPAPRKKGPVKKPPDKPLPLPDSDRTP
jgi:hypothetical protein